MHHVEAEHSLVEALTNGMTTPQISQLLTVAQRWLLERKGVVLRRQKPFHKFPQAPLSEMVDGISGHLAAPNTAALALAHGRINHWTVIRSVGTKSIKLFDSSGMQRVRLQSIDSRLPEPSGKTLQIVPTGLFLLAAPL